MASDQYEPIRSVLNTVPVVGTLDPGGEMRGLHRREHATNIASVRMTEKRYSLSSEAFRCPGKTDFWTGANCRFAPRYSLYLSGLGFYRHVSTAHVWTFKWWVVDILVIGVF